MLQIKAASDEGEGLGHASDEGEGLGHARQLTEAWDIADLSAGIPNVCISTVKETHFFL